MSLGHLSPPPPWQIFLIRAWSAKSVQMTTFRFLRLLLHRIIPISQINLKCILTESTLKPPFYIKYISRLIFFYFICCHAGVCFNLTDWYAMPNGCMIVILDLSSVSHSWFALQRNFICCITIGHLILDYMNKIKMKRFFVWNWCKIDLHSPHESPKKTFHCLKNLRFVQG